MQTLGKGLACKDEHAEARKTMSQREPQRGKEHQRENKLTQCNFC